MKFKARCGRRRPGRCPVRPRGRGGLGLLRGSAAGPGAAGLARGSGERGERRAAGRTCARPGQGRRAAGCVQPAGCGCVRLPGCGRVYPELFFKMEGPRAWTLNCRPRVPARVRDPVLCGKPTLPCLPFRRNYGWIGSVLRSDSPSSLGGRGGGGGDTSDQLMCVCETGSGKQSFRLLGIRLARGGESRALRGGYF